MKVIDVFTKSD